MTTVLGDSGPGHWQTLWEQTRGDCRRVELGMWDRPHRNTWVNKLNLAIRSAGRPVVLVAHSLGCHAAVWWAQLAREETSSVIGALLVAPPELDENPRDARLRAFAPTPFLRLPFPSILAASHDDPYMSLRAARRLARAWGSGFADAGKVGHINADSDLGDWAFGQFLLTRLLAGAQPPRNAAAAIDLHAPASGNGAAAAGEASRFAHGREASFASPAMLRSGRPQ